MTDLHTDLYELRLAAGYLRRGIDSPATFSLYARRLPRHRGFLVAAGLADALAFLGSYRFDPTDLDYLRGTGDLDADGLAGLGGLRFTGDVWAVPEGRLVFADEPLLEVTAPIAEAQLVGAALLNVLTHQTSIASKAARCRLAAAGAELIDLSFRRSHGLAAAMVAARSSAIAGFAATSNAEAARRYGLRPAGPVAHSSIPADAALVLDSHGDLAGVRAAVAGLARERPRGPIGVRLDSGDPGGLAVAARRLLDQAGLPHVRLIASGDLDEDEIAALVQAGAPIDAYGVGTRMGVSSDAPSLDSTCRLVEFGGRPVLDRPTGKAADPGAKQVFRSTGAVDADVLGLRDEPAPAGREPLLAPVMRGGRPLETADPAAQVRAARRRFEQDLAWLPGTARRLSDPVPVPVRRSDRLADLSRRMVTARTTT